MSYQKILPYSGVDLNYHLNPLPRFDRDQVYPTQKKFLDHEVPSSILFDLLIDFNGYHLNYFKSQGCD